MAQIPQIAGVTLPAGASGQHGPVTIYDWLNTLTTQSPLDVYDIHELGWRRAVLLAKREKQEFLVRYIGWDAKWDEWIRATSNRLAPANSKTASLAYTGFKGPKSADEISSQELSHDWNASRQAGVLCDILFCMHQNKSYEKPGTKPPSCTNTPSKRTHRSMREEGERSLSISGHHSNSNTPATSPMVRGLSGLGLVSPQVSPMLTPAHPHHAAMPHSATPSAHTQSTPIYFPAHRHMIATRCPDLLKSALISLPPLFDFTRIHPSGSGSVSSSLSRSLARYDALTAQHSQAALLFSPSLDDFSLEPHHSTAQPSISVGGIGSLEHKLDDSILSLDDSEHVVGGDGGSVSISGSTRKESYPELSPDAQVLEVSCVPNAAVMQNLLTYLYTGTLEQHMLPGVRHVFELASVGTMLHLERLSDLCALALNRMICTDNFMMCLIYALKFQQCVLGDGEGGLEDSMSVTNLTFKSLSPLLKVCLEYIVSHWEQCWSSAANMQALQTLSPSLFGMVLQLLPLRNIHNSAFAPTYPIVHPAPCTLTSHFKSLWESRSMSTCDFTIHLDGHIIPCHKAVLATRSEYFRAMFRSPFQEGAGSSMIMDASQHSVGSMESLLKYLYYADLKINPDCAIYLSNCTDFFGLSSNRLENACQELVSQHQCLRVLRNAWQNCNEHLFKRACKFMDWATLATLMNGQSMEAEAEVGVAGEHGQHGGDDVNEDDEDDEGEEEDEEVEEGEDEEEGEVEQEDDVEDEEAEEAEMVQAEADEDTDGEVQMNDAHATIAAPLDTSPPSTVAAAVAPLLSSAPAHSSSFFSASTASASPPRATTSASSRSSSHSSHPLTTVDLSDIEMWKAIVAEKANPSTQHTTFQRNNLNSSFSSPTKRSRSQ